MRKIKYSVSNIDIKKLDKNKSSINHKKCDKITKNIINNLENLESIFDNINDDINSLIDEGVVKSKYTNMFKGWAKKCSNQIMITRDLKNYIQTNYASTDNEILIKNLDERIVELEKKIMKMEGV